MKNCIFTFISLLAILSTSAFAQNLSSNGDGPGNSGLDVTRISVSTDSKARTLFLNLSETKAAIKEITDLAKSQKIKLNSAPLHITSEVNGNTATTIDQKHKLIFTDKNEKNQCSNTVYVTWDIKTKKILNAQNLGTVRCIGEE